MGEYQVLNEKCVEQALRTALALSFNINQRSFFDRKHYFYPDLPAGYQITQQYIPFAERGRLLIRLSGGEEKVVGLQRLQLEHDSGTISRDFHPFLYCIDLNRAGMPLMEIVSDPVFRSSEEAGAYVRKLRHLLWHLGTCDGSMEKGSLRVDVNISLRQKGTDTFGTRCELKNINSIKNLMKAIDFEIERQSKLLDAGEKVVQETRTYDAAKNVTVRIRSKEDEVDYRFMPEPDLPPLVISKGQIQHVLQNLPELPDALCQRLKDQYGLSEYDISVLVEAGATHYFEELCKHHDARTACNWITTELFGRMNDQDYVDISSCPVTVHQLGSVLALIEQQDISGRVGKQVLSIMFQGDTRMAAEIVEEKQWKQLSDPDKIRSICEKLISKNPAQVKKYASGKKKYMVSFFVGQIMKETKGMAHPELSNEILINLLERKTSQ